MQAKLRHLHSPDVMDLRGHRPSGEAFCLLVQAIIGPADGPGEESFDIEICSPAWLAEQIERDRIVSGRCRLFMAAFDYDVLERYVMKLVAQASGTSWIEVASKLAQWSHWELTDYIECR